MNKTLLIAAGVSLLMGSVHAVANVAPAVTLVSAAMRPDSTLMDITYRVEDSDDATVKVRALAFIDGVRSFANVIRPATFVEGTEANLGDAVPVGVEHALAWDVGADWDIDLGQLKFEVLAMDGRGLLPFDWITIPATATTDELTISKSVPTGGELLDALLWLYATWDERLVLENGVLKGTESSGLFAAEVLAVGSVPQVVATPFLYQAMDVDGATLGERDLAIAARSSGITDRTALRAARRSWTWDDGLFSKDPAAIDGEIINWRWVKNIYGDGAATMTDRSRGLMWVDAPHALAGNSSGMPWDDAVGFCENLSYAGHSDWRLPYVNHPDGTGGPIRPRELEEMPSQRAFFSGVQNHYYWSGTSRAYQYTHHAWSVYMVDGIVYSSDKTNNGRVWPVRGGQ